MLIVLISQFDRKAKLTNEFETNEKTRKGVVLIFLDINYEFLKLFQTEVQV